MTFYNEFDKFAANWLRQLQLKGLITDGHVEEKSITDLKAKDLKDATRAHFFAGIGGWDLALQLAGWPQEAPVWTGSCPCQPFSDAGKRAGTADERHLWPQFARLIKAQRPPVIFGEQVASAAGRDWLSGVRADLEGMGYELGGADLCAAGFNAPHIRQRLYWMAYANGQRRHRVEDPTGPHGRPGSENRGRLDHGQRLGRNAGRQNHQGDERLVADPTIPGRRLGNTSGARLAPSQPQAVLAKGRGQEGRAALQPGGAPVSGVVQPQRFGALGAPGDRAGSKGSVQGARCADAGLDEAGDAGAPGRLEHAQGLGRIQRWPEPGRGSLVRGRGQGPWSDYYLIPCSDGKTRRVGTGLFPLADGVPRRVGKLRGAGNAIVPVQAATFVRVCMEFLGMVR